MVALDRVNFNMLSLNTRGLRAFKKRRKIYHWLSKKKCDNGMTLLQEAHCDFESKHSLEHVWQGKSFFSHGTHKSWGVITLIGRKLDFKSLNKETDSNGRLIIIYGLFQEAHLLIINTYLCSQYRKRTTVIFQSSL